MMLNKNSNQYFRSSSFHHEYFSLPVAIVFFFLVGSVNGQGSINGGRNAIIARNGSTVACFGSDGLRVRLSDGTVITQALPNGVASFDDITRDGRIIFALSTTSRVICSYRQRGNGSLKRRNCVGSGNIATSPYCGISAKGGNLIVSGGTGGFSYFTYKNSGKIRSSPRILNEQVTGVIGFPDVTMISRNLIAFSTDFSTSNQSQRFGVLIASIGKDRQVTMVRNFRINGSGFANALSPANFALRNAVLKNDSGTYLYSAHGVMTVTDPTQDGFAQVISVDLDGFQAVTVTVNESGNRVYFGGVLGNDSVVLEFNVQQPMAPMLVAILFAQGRITSVAASSKVVTYLRNENNSRIRTAS